MNCIFFSDSLRQYRKHPIAEVLTEYALAIHCYFGALEIHYCVLWCNIRNSTITHCEHGNYQIVHSYLSENNLCPRLCRLLQVVVSARHSQFHFQMFGRLEHSSLYNIFYFNAHKHWIWFREERQTHEVSKLQV